MRFPSILVLASMFLVAGCSATSALSDELCGSDDAACPPTEPVMRPGHLVPVYETRQKPIYKERKIPIWGEKTVPVYQMRRTPVTITLPDMCGCDRVVELWDRSDKVQVGVKRVRACLGYRTEKVQVGTCPEKVRVGWRTVNDRGCTP